MSQIALFYTIDNNLGEALLEAAVPQRKIIEKKILWFTRNVEQPIDTFWDFLKEQATAQESFGYSGRGFIDLELLLEEKGINLYKFGSDEFARKVATARPAVVAVFDQAAAQQTINLLAKVKLTKDEAQRYSRDNFPKEDDALVAESILAAYDLFKKWLAAVGESQIGLLIIG